MSADNQTGTTTEETASSEPPQKTSEAGQATAGDGTSSYNDWIRDRQTRRNKDWQLNTTFKKAEDTPLPPAFEQVELFHAGVEDYARTMTSVCSTDVQTVAKRTQELDMFSPCMVGTLESQFLALMVKCSGAKRCLDVGTFTGMSALAMAEAVPDDGAVVTLEFDEKIAAVAQKSFDESKQAKKITIMQGAASDAMEALLAKGEKFDIVFLDADKENYITYYEIAMKGLLNPRGFILADNALCSLLYDASDERSKKLHEFNQHVRNDPRTEQVMLTIREGVSMIRPVDS